MLRYQIGSIKERWENIVPPIQKEAVGKDIDGRWLDRGVDEEYASNSTSFSFILNDTSAPRHRTPISNCSSRSSVSDDESVGLHEQEGLNEEHLSSEQKSLDEIAHSFRILITRLESKGLYNCPYWAYTFDAFRITSLFSLMLFLLHRGWIMASAVFMGCFWHQLVFIAHDAGHKGITHSYHIDTLIGMTVANHIGGLSLGWWKRSHNIHHIVTNSPAHDPDIEHLPFLAISPNFFKSLYSTYYDRIMPYTKFAQFMVPHQKWLYYPLLCFGRFNLYALSWEYLFLNLGPKSNKWHRLYEISGQIFFWYWFGYRIMYLSIPTNSLRICFLLISHMVTMPLHVQFTLSHFAMSTTTPSPNEPWAMQQLRTTMDVDCPPWLDWFHGGLQFQAVHHLFPTLPRHNLREASMEVREWCEGAGVKYEIYGWGECNGRVLGRLEEVGRQARFLRECQERVLEKGDFLKGEWEA